MLEADAGGGDAPVSDAPVTDPNTPAAPPADGTLLSGAAGADAPDGGGDGDPSPQPGAWRDDWREGLVEKLPAAEREKELTRLKRFASPDNVYASLRAMEKKLSAGQIKASLPENPTPEEVAAYRKASGIPEAPDGYGLAFPDGLQVGEADKADLAGFAKHMHEANVPPSAVKAAFDYFTQIRTQAEERVGQAAHEASIAAQAELRSEYGRDFGRNVALANRFAEQHGGEAAKDLMRLPLADGTLLGNRPEFVRMLVTAALNTADDDVLVTTPGGGTAAGVDRYKELMSKPRMSAAESAEAQRLAVELAKKGIDFSL